MIYFDNGATSFPKPAGMAEVMEECITQYCGNPGRSGHKMSLRTGEEVYRARRKVAELFNIQDAQRVVFTKNTTEALNLGIHGFLKKGDHVVTTSMEHNSVLRPLKAMERHGVQHTIVMADKEGCVSPDMIEKATRSNTAMIIMTAASNICGSKMPLKEVGDMAARSGRIFFVDAAQGAGVMDLDVRKLNIDMMAFPGHKGLLGPMGTGALYVRPGIELAPIMEGGTGTESRSRSQPCVFPEGYEAGTINAPAIIGLGYLAGFVYKVGPEVIGRYEEDLICRLEEKIRNMKGVSVYGPAPGKKTGISLININGISAEEVTTMLSETYGIAVRGGYHCAGLAHKTIGTWDKGAVRISAGLYNTKKEIDFLCDALWSIKKSLC